jgi:dephospho-CoA kinase
VPRVVYITGDIGTGKTTLLRARSDYSQRTARQAVLVDALQTTPSTEPAPWSGEL